MVYTKTELYRTNTKSQGLVPAYFALILRIIVVHVVKHQSVLINTYTGKTTRNNGPERKSVLSSETDQKRSQRIAEFNGYRMATCFSPFYWGEP